MQNIGKEIGGYVLSVILIITGGIFTYKYLGAEGLEEQPGHLLWGGLFLMLVGVVALPVIARKISVGASRILLAVGVLGSIYLGYSVFSSIDEDIQFIADQKAYNEQTIQSLKDIRLAQEGYKEMHGMYTDNWDSLAAYIMVPSIPVVYKKGIVNDTIEGGLREYIELGWVLKRHELPIMADSLGYGEEEFGDLIDDQKIPYIVIDTTYISLWDQSFKPEVREAEELPLVVLDKLPFNPVHGDRYYIETSSVPQAGVNVSTILVQDPNPFPYQPPYPFGRDKMKKDTLRFGNLTDPHTDGNWRR
jgi:hypothetical protein